jgi:glutathione synthase/RimK-type ligase-like ATP-grasp enzyme
VTRPRLALATWAQRWPIADDEDELVLAALRAAGAIAERAVWDQDDIDADACVIRTTWDYFERRAEFLEWADRVAAARPVWNSPAVLRWNAHKGYLIELEQRGIPVPPMAMLRPNEDVLAVIRDRGWSRVIVKPAVGVGALRTLVAYADEGDRLRAHVADLAQDTDVIVQDYLESIHDRGECSLVFFEGVLSHAVRKVPAAGDYRAHPYWGATVEPIVPSPDQVEAGRRALAVVPEPALYARVDLLAGADGMPALIELELIEPYLFLEPASADRFARAILTRLS